MTRLRFSLAALLLAMQCMAAAKPAPAPEKVLRGFLTTSETGLDPAVASDLATLSVLENLFDPLLRYDYLARPVALRPNTAAAMPTVAKDGMTYTFQIRRGLYFTPDPAFKGVRREVTAADYVYSLTRLYDPALGSPWLFLFEGKLAGDAQLKKSFSYTTPIAGLQALDRYTLRIRLNAPDRNFLLYLATPASSVVAREVIDAYPGQAGNHPVGTGPFRIGTWKRSDTMVLLANRENVPPFASTQAGDPVAAALQGKRLPLLDRIELRIAEEFQGRMLGFLGGEYDLLEQVPESLTGMVIDAGMLKPALAARAITLTRFPVLQTYYMWMNMEDPVLGGYAKDRVALRRAIALSYNSGEDVHLLKKGFAQRAESPLPPTVLGHDPAYRSPVRYDPALANALLDRHGYTGRDPDGLRRAPGGAPLTLTMYSEATITGRLRDEFWRKNLNAIGLRVVFRSDKKTEIIKASRLGKVQMFESNWVADFPDADNFYQLLYGSNRGRANYARFDLPEFNRRFDATRMSTDPALRQQLYNEMNDLVHAYNPWVPLTHPISADLRHPWVRNYRRHPVELTTWRYLDIDAGMRERVREAR